MSPPYVHLHAHSWYSFLDGVSSPEALAARAAAHGQAALALTDHCGVYGAPEFRDAARDRGVRPLYGAEITVPDFGDLTLLVRDAEGWRSLCRLITAARARGRGTRRAGRGHAPVPWPLVAAHRAGLVCLSGDQGGPLARALLAGDPEAAETAARRLRATFGADLWIEIARNRLAGDGPLGRALADLADRLGLGYVATANAHYADPTDAPLGDVVACVRSGTTLAAARHLRPNGAFDLAPTAEMRARFADLPTALTNTVVVAGRCGFALAATRHRFPGLDLPAGQDPDGALRARCRAGAAARYGGGDSNLRRRAAARLDEELAVVRDLGLAPYFLLVADLVGWARGQGILCQGRGSACGSVISYALGIARVEPIAERLLFSRFLSRERAAELPDIDLDFPHDRREEVIRHLYDRYGRDRVAMACTVVCYEERGALRDAGKALGIPPRALEELARWRRRGLDADLRAAVAAVAGPGAPDRRPWSTLLALAPRLVGHPRHVGLHNGGMVLCGVPLAEIVPVEPAAMPGRTAVQWDKEALERMGLVKLDVLSLQALALVGEAARLLAGDDGAPLDFDHIPLDDEAVYARLRRAATTGVFALESRAQQALLPALAPACLADLTIATSLIRPGPLQAGLVAPYLRRRQGREPVTYPHPSLAPILAPSLGIILWQEQVIACAVALAGFAPGEADQLRRAMGAKRSRERMAALEGRFLRGAAANGVAEGTARAVFAAIAAFGSYGFPRAHAAAFARLAYESAWLLVRHPAIFHCARLNATPGGFYSPDTYRFAAERDGVPVLGPDLGRSGWRCAVEGGAVRLGLRFMRGLGEAAGAALVAERERGGAYRGLADLCRRGRGALTPVAVEALIAAGACDGWGVPRRELLWRLPAAWRGAGGLALPVPAPALPPATPAEALAGEVWATGIPLAAHPVALVRAGLDAAGVLPLAALADQPAGARVALAGRVVALQRPPTARGMCFVSLEDERATANLVLDPVTDRRYRAALHAPVVVAEGRVEHRRGDISLRVTALRPWDVPGG